MKIVILDGYAVNPGDLSWGEFEKLGEVTVYDRCSVTDESEAIGRIGDAEIIYTSKTPVTKKVIDACPNLKMISVLATGYNVVDHEYAKEKGIPVTNIPSYGTASVAQFAIALLLEICCRVGHHNDSVHSGKWEKSIEWCYWDYPLIELDGKTMGIIGFGRIGRSTGRIAKALGMKILAFDQYPDDAGKEIINRDSIAKMKDGVILLNNSRGPLVVEQDLADALNSGKIAAAGLDVVAAEPIRGDNPLLKAKNCIITPHISWAAKESRQRLMDCALENAKAFLAGAPVNVVNG